MEPIKVTFLGTSGSVPQKDKNFASAVITLSGSNLLFDCPEGNQRQLMKSNVSLMKIKNVFISHMHADHFLGLFGWIATMTLNDRRDKLTIFSPRGGKQKIQRIMKEIIKPSFEIEYKEVKTGIILKEENFSISAFALKHEIACFGFVFREKDKEGEFDRKKAEKLGIPPGPMYSKLIAGKKVKIGKKTFTKKDVMNYNKKRVGRKIVFVSDTRPINTTMTKAMGADLLIHESSFLEDHQQNAIDSLHSTAREAANIAKKAKVKQLALFHFSARLDDVKEIQKEAKSVFTNSVVVKDFDEIKL